MQVGSMLAQVAAYWCHVGFILGHVDSMLAHVGLMLSQVGSKLAAGGFMFAPCRLMLTSCWLIFRTWFGMVLPCPRVRPHVYYLLAHSLKQMLDLLGHRQCSFCIDNLAIGRYDV